MSLLDEHLAKALKHAPDSDLVPSELVRKSVLDYANKVNNANKPSQHPHGHWLAGLLSNIKNWPKKWYFAGMSSVAVALLAVIMLREQLPQEPVWREADVKEIAKNSAPAPEIATKEESVDRTAAPATIQQEAPARTADAQQKAKVESPAAALDLADKDNVVVAAAPAATTATSPAEQSLSKQNTSDLELRSDLELKGGLETAPASDVVADLPEQATAKPAAVAKKSERLEGASNLNILEAQGIAKAKQDIQAGVLRIFVAEWPADKLLLDEATGYRLELAPDLAPAELAAYNQTMRDWFKTQH